MSEGYINVENKSVFSHLPSAERGDVSSQNELCRIFYEHPEITGTMPDDFWEKIEACAQKDEDYANFILHCRYFEKSSQSNLSYEHIRRAIRKAQIPLAFLRLGITYSKGIGTSVNFALANYFFDKARTMGCPEADSLIEKEYDLGEKVISREIEIALTSGEDISPETMSRFAKRLEKERLKKNYGHLSRLREHLHLFYPDYSQEKAIDDILNNHDTVDADIFYSIFTRDNYDEICMDVQECILHQLYAPVSQDEEMIQLFKEYNTRLLRDEEHALYQSYINFTNVYDTLSKDNRVKKAHIPEETVELFPYINVQGLSLWRRHTLKCLLSLKEVHPVIKDRYLENLGNDDRLLDICEEVRDMKLQSFLISFVEVNINLEVLEKKNLAILNAYRHNDRESLANNLNDYVKRITDAGIACQLPIFTPETLPSIEIDNC